jgi:hypothetical protein
MGKVGRSTTDRSGSRHGKETPDGYRSSERLNRLTAPSEKRKSTDGLLGTDNARNDDGDYEGGQ